MHDAAMIRHLFKPLCAELRVAEISGISVRPFQAPGDLQGWLDLRERAFTGQSPSVGKWSQADMRRELLDKPWWKPERTLMAVCRATAKVVGSATLAVQIRNQRPTATLHWLMVEHAWRRRGVGRALVSQLEHAAWADGFRQVWLETHTGWKGATSLYLKLGYQLVGDPHPATLE